MSERRHQIYDCRIIRRDGKEHVISGDERAAEALARSAKITFTENDDAGVTRVTCSICGFRHLSKKWSPPYICPACEQQTEGAR